MPIVAAAIDTSTVASIFNNGLINPDVPLWNRGDDLYAIAIHQSSGHDNCAIWKSTDAGATWTIQDASSEPDSCSMFANALDGDTMYVLAAPLTSDPSDQTMRLFAFDCATDTWSLVSGSGPLGHWASNLLIHGSGAIAVYGKLGADDLWIATYAAGSWSVLVDLTTVTDPALSPLDVFGCVDQDDRPHFIFHGTSADQYWHVSLATDLLSADTPDDMSGLGIIRQGGIVAVGSSLYVGCALTGANVTFLEGTPLSAPTFAAGPLSALTENNFLNIRYDSTDALLVMVSLKDSLSVFEIAKTPLPATSWTTSNLYDANTDAQPPDMDAASGMYVTGMRAVAGELLLVSDYINSALGYVKTSFYVGKFALAVTPPTAHLRNSFE